MNMSKDRTAWVNGVGALALVPFVAGAVGVWIGDATSRAFAAQALSAYAAVVVSFIGGIHWGFGFRQAVPSALPFFRGVLPSIVVWNALLASPRIALPIEAAMLAICYLVDRATYPAEGAAAWLPLRLRLTVVAVVCCVVATFGR